MEQIAKYFLTPNVIHPRPQFDTYISAVPYCLSLTHVIIMHALVNVASYLEICFNNEVNFSCLQTELEGDVADSDLDYILVFRNEPE